MQALSLPTRIISVRCWRRDKPETAGRTAIARCVFITLFWATFSELKLELATLLRLLWAIARNSSVASFILWRAAEIFEWWWADNGTDDSDFAQASNLSSSWSRDDTCIINSFVFNGTRHYLSITSFDSTCKFSGRCIKTGRLFGLIRTYV